VQTQLERLERYFSAHAKDWEDLYSQPKRVNDLVLANRRRLGLEGIRRYVPPGGRVLDAGCGAGLTALDLAEHGFYVHGVDIATNMLEICRRRFSQAQISVDRYDFTHGSVANIQFEPESFEGIIALGFLEYQDDETGILQRFWQLLKPGGALVVSGATARTIANYWSLPDELEKQLGKLGLVKPRPDTERLWVHRYNCRRFRALLATTGFEMLGCQGHGFAQVRGIAPRIGYRGELWLHHALSSIARILPIGRFGNDTICYARKHQIRR
jgi:ubiquinone/menaquinone biosynthesis C-methylase UbiE